MKTKVFTFNTGGDFLILGLARIIGDKCRVIFCYSNNGNEFTPSDYFYMDLEPIKKWARKNGAVDLFMPYHEDCSL